MARNSTANCFGKSQISKQEGWSFLFRHRVWQEEIKTKVTIIITQTHDMLTSLVSKMAFV